MEPPPPASGAAGSSSSSSSSAPSKKRKAAPGTSKSNGDGEGGGDGENREGGPKKRPQSCDVCRARKVKCVKPPEAARCDGCVSLDQRCEYTHERKKPGPANSYARKPSPPRQTYSGYMPNVPQPPGHSRSYSNGPDGRGPAQPSAFPLDHHSSLGPLDHQSSMGPPGWTVPVPSHHITHNHLGSTSNAFLPSTGMDATLEAPWLPISPNSLLHPQPGEADSASEDSPMGRWAWMSGLDDIFDPSSLQHTATSSSNGHDSSLPGGVQNQGMQGGQADMTRTSTVTFDLGPSPEASAGPSASASVSHFPAVRRADEKCTRIEDVAPFSTITRILHGYHAHLYPLMPVLHWPTFSQQLVAREDERSDSWRAFVLSLVAYSVIQLPRSALSFLHVRELRRLHQRCHLESKKLRDRRYREVRLIDIATLYCDHIYLGTLGRTHAANVTLAEAIRLAQTMNLHDERLGDPVYDVIERETRRRVFWLLYGSDRTITALTSNPLYIQDCDLCLPLPMAIDDALLTTAGAFPQPAHTTPVLAGFHFGVRLFRLLGVILTSHRNLSASWLNPATDPFPMLNLSPMPVQIRPSQQFFDELERIIADLPGPLQLANPTGNGSNHPSSKSTPPTIIPSGGETAAAKDLGFAICRANLLVNQAMVRFAIRQYARAVGEEEGQDGGKEWAERDVLSLLESMSSESLAANGESLRRKVLFVASSLLEQHKSTSEGHNYVSDFLAVFTRISEEQHATLLEDSAAPSREPSPGLGVGGGGAVAGGGGGSMGLLTSLTAGDS